MAIIGSELFVEAESVTLEEVDTGVSRRILGYDAGLMMTHVVFRKGTAGARHHHPHRQVSYIARGSFEVFIGNEKRILKTGDCYFVPPDIDHGVVALEDGSVVDVFAPARTEFVRQQSGPVLLTNEASAEPQR
jgi:quercetin dioxygenase-like cupin family protein